MIEMMERLPSLIIFFNLLLMASVSDSATTRIKSFMSSTKLKSIYTFGDSLFDPGNNHFVKNCTIQADFPPYGSAYFKRPTGRFTNGRTVADFTAQFMGLDLQQPFQQINQNLANGSRKSLPADGIGFASAGSGVFRETNKKEGISSFHVQVEQFEGLIDKNLLSRDNIQQSLFMLESGSNDIFEWHTSSMVPKLFPQAHVDKLLKDYTSVVEKLYKFGARKIAIFGVGPMGCIPGTVLLPQLPIAPKTKCADKINDMIKSYNDGLENLVNSIPKKHPGASAVYGAVYDVTNMIVASPKTYGFENVDDACCGAGPRNGKVQCGLDGYQKCSKPNEYMFWDYFHPGEHAYKVLAKAFWEGDKSKVRPMNLKALANTKE